MRVNVFQKGVARTFNKKSYELDLLHCAIGLITEVGELFESREDLVNKREELGDVYWYLGALGNVLRTDLCNYTFQRVDIGLDNTITKQKTLDSLIINMGALIDILKKHIYYSKPLTIWQKVGVFIKLVFDGEQSSELFHEEHYYLKPLDKQLVVNHICTVWSILDTYGMHFNITREECLSANQAKLRERFKAKFTEWDAMNRNLKVERKALEDGK